MSMEVEMTRIPDCDIHPGVPAKVDGKTHMGPWAYMCGDCFVAYGMGLGTGLGQRLILRQATS